MKKYRNKSMMGIKSPAHEIRTTVNVLIQVQSMLLLENIRLKESCTTIGV